MQCDRHSLLLEGSTCWRREHATRAALLIDSASYFAALCSALLEARHQILIAGWEIDTRTILMHGGAGQSGPVRLGELLGSVVRNRPDLRVYVSCWDHHPLYARRREPRLAARLQHHGAERIRFCADDRHPTTGCVHHKVVVIDDAVAFCGGIDLTQRRWDTSVHAPDEARRRDHAGRPYRPMHDAQMLVAGPVAAALGEHLRQRWQVVRGIEIPAPPASPPTDPWPRHVRVDFTDVPVGISRTLPTHDGSPAVTEIQSLYEHAIRASRRELYFENQYYTAQPIARALTDALRRRPQLQALLAAPAAPRTWPEHCTMGYGRLQFHRHLQDAGALDRLALVAPCDAAGQPIIVHSKLAVFDDRLLLVGSANLNHRSMGFDAECSLAVEARCAAHRERIRLLRNRLIGEHVDRTAEEIAAAQAACSGLAQLPACLADRPRRLLPIEPSGGAVPHLGPLLCPLFDRGHATRGRSPVRRARSWGLSPFSALRHSGRLLAGWSRIVLLAAAAVFGLALVGQSVFTDGHAARTALQQWSELFED